MAMKPQNLYEAWLQDPSIDEETKEELRGIEGQREKSRIDFIGTWSSERAASRRHGRGHEPDEPLRHRQGDARLREFPARTSLRRLPSSSRMIPATTPTFLS